MSAGAVLDPGTVYLCGDRFVCGTSRCAGMTALYTGHGLNGEKVRPVDGRDVREWATYGLGPLVCECGAQTATEPGSARPPEYDGTPWPPGNGDPNSAERTSNV